MPPVAAIEISNEFSFTLTLGGIIAGLACAVRSIRWALGVRDELLSLQRKVQVMWNFQLRRGASEAAMAGLPTDPEAPAFPLPERVRIAFAGLRDALVGFYREHGRYLSDAEMALEIEGRFGHRLVSEVCNVLGWHHGACLHVAALIAKGRDGPLVPPSILVPG